jgi:hypothetical protein
LTILVVTKAYLFFSVLYVSCLFCTLTLYLSVPIALAYISVVYNRCSLFIVSSFSEQQLNNVSLYWWRETFSVSYELPFEILFRLPCNYEELAIIFPLLRCLLYHWRFYILIVYIIYNI